jgi:hypothetical protein
MTDYEPLGKYRFLAELGKGGFATVYRAEDTTLEREVAPRTVWAIMSAIESLAVSSSAMAALYCLRRRSRMLTGLFPGRRSFHKGFAFTMPENQTDFSFLPPVTKKHQLPLHSYGRLGG